MAKEIQGKKIILLKNLCISFLSDTSITFTFTLLFRVMKLVIVMYVVNWKEWL